MHGYTANKDDILKRLRRSEGQVRGLQPLVEQDTYCIDVLTQVGATTKALQPSGSPCWRNVSTPASLPPFRTAATRPVARSRRPPRPLPGWSAPDGVSRR